MNKRNTESDCLWINSTWQRLSTSSEAVGFSYEIYAWTFQFLSYFIEKSQNSVDNTFQRWMILCALSALDVRATVCSLCVYVTEQQRIRLERRLTDLYNKLFKTCILPFNFEHPVI